MERREHVIWKVKEYDGDKLTQYAVINRRRQAVYARMARIADGVRGPLPGGTRSGTRSFNPNEQRRFA